MRRSIALVSLVSLTLISAACQQPQPAEAPVSTGGPPPGYNGPPVGGTIVQQPGQPAQPVQPVVYPQPIPGQPGQPVQPGQPLPAPVPPQPVQPATALLPPLVGTGMWQAEAQAVLQEQRSNLSADNQARVNGVPLNFDPNPFEINAYATCTQSGSPIIVGTEGLLEAIDGISQTVATDDLYGTQTYAAYTAAVMPALGSSNNASAALPANIIPANLIGQPARMSHAHELFDEIVAFTFGHEMSHHYLGHTGCANGPPNPLALGQQVLNAIINHGPPTFTQPLELAADNAGCLNTLDSGKARATRGMFKWTERGGLLLLDFFSRLEKASGLNAVNPVSYIQTHPSSPIRIQWVTAEAAIWRLQHPGS